MTDIETFHADLDETRDDINGVVRSESKIWVTGHLTADISVDPPTGLELVDDPYLTEW